MRSRARPPGGQSEPAATHPCQLSGRGLLAGAKMTERGADDVEGPVLEGKSLGISSTHSTSELRARACSSPWRDVEPGRRGSGLSRPHGHFPVPVATSSQRSPRAVPADGRAHRESRQSVRQRARTRRCSKAQRRSSSRARRPVLSRHAREHTSVVSDLFLRRGRLACPTSPRSRCACAPSTLDEFVGQDQVLGEGSALRLAIADDRVGSMILSGRPAPARPRSRGSSPHARARPSRSSPPSRPRVEGRSRGARRARERARHERAAHDPVPRRDPPLQQGPAGRAACRPSRTGSSTLIGATTENPYFEVNARAPVALRRCYELEPLVRATSSAVLVRLGAAALEADGRTTLRRADRRAARGGDARNALDILELAAADGAAEGVAPTARSRRGRARKRPLVYDKGGDAHYNFISRLHQVDARPDPDAAVYCLTACSRRARTRSSSRGG